MFQVTGTFSSNFYSKEYVSGRTITTGQYPPQKYVYNPKNNKYIVTFIYDGEYNNSQYTTFPIDVSLKTQNITINGNIFTFNITLNSEKIVIGTFFSNKPHDNGEFKLVLTF